MGPGHLPNWKHVGPHLPRISLIPNLYKNSLLAAESPGLTEYFVLNSPGQIPNALGIRETRNRVLGLHHTLWAHRRNLLSLLYVRNPTFSISCS